jgi:hypothetical protein
LPLGVLSTSAISPFFSMSRRSGGLR